MKSKMYSRRRNTSNYLSTIICITAVIVIIWTQVSIVGTKNTYNITVTDKAIKNSSESSKYLIYAELDSGEVKVFENTDQLLVGKFNSSDIYAKLKVGNQYRINTIGIRAQLLSMYENIVLVEDIK